MRRSRIYNADKKKAEVELTWTRWSSIAQGYCKRESRWITFSVTAYHQESSLFSNAVFRCQNIISLVPTGWSLKLSPGGGGGGGGGFFWEGGGDHLIFMRKKEGIGRNWEPKTGDHWKLCKDQGRGETAQICLENEDIGWGDRESHQVLLGRSQSVK